MLIFTRSSFALLSSAVIAFAPHSAVCGQSPGPRQPDPVTPAASITEVMVQGLGADDRGRRVGIDLAAVRRAAARDGRVALRGLPLDRGREADVELEQFFVTSPRTQFVMGRRHGPDDPIDFDPSTLVLLRGGVVGEPGSSALLMLGPRGTAGSISLDGGSRRWRLRSDHFAADDGLGNRLTITPEAGAIALPPGVKFCEALAASDDPTPDAANARVGGVTPSTIGRRVIDLAVETDYDLFRLAGNEETAVNEYIVQLYATISDIYQRDVNTRINLTYVRLWDTPADLFNEPDPLGPFRTYWNANMGAIERDAAQFISGRRDLPYGGVAYLSALCSSAAYSVCGYFLGSFPDSTAPSVDHYDVHVAAHELGHNFGANHTHFYGIDTCNDFNGTPQRGTIMSYCSQTVSGGNANTDLRFHADVVPFMTAHITGVACVITDCNGNGFDDADDIAGATSPDANANAIPDECEDCNNNGTLDDADIAAGAPDVDGNGVPDECEPDCNANGTPDAWDIATGPSTDLHGNFIPDECEPDCNANGLSDYNELMADMSLDLDRDTVLDECQDCDDDGVNDLVQLGGAHSVWVASDIADHLKQFHPVSGVRTGVSAVGFVSRPMDVLITDDGRILVASAGDDRIVEFDRFGGIVGDFVPAGLGGLDFPAALTLGPDGNLFVASGNTSSVLEYDGQTGAFIDVFVDPPPGPGERVSGTPSVLQPYGLAFGPNGNLFVSSADHQVLEFDGVTGDFVSIFVAAASNGGLTDPRQLVFLPNGNLVVASFATKELLAYDGATGAPLGKFNNGGTDAALTFDEPWGLRIGPDGFLYASRHGAITTARGDSLPDDIAELHVNSTRLYKYDADNGDFIRSYILGNDTGLDAPAGFDFMPGAGYDCDFNLIPDTCDIAAGAEDANGNLVPDQCECLADADGSGDVNIEDLLALLANWGGCAGACPPACTGDVDGNCAVDIFDLLQVLADWGDCTN